MPNPHASSQGGEPQAPAIRVGILTVSDRSARGERSDASGPALAEAVSRQLSGATVAQTALVADDVAAISAILVGWADEGGLDLVLTTGGTGFAPRDVTPEATNAVIDREAPGLAEAMRAASLRITPHAMLSRAMAGMRGHTLIVNLPGSPKAALENLATILPVLPHAIELLRDQPGAEAHHLTTRPSN
jgi:molybdenum cofactor synthesis domain-containing protein